MAKTWAKPVQVRPVVRAAPAKGKGKDAGNWVWVPSGANMGRTVTNSLRAPIRSIVKPVVGRFGGKGVGGKGVGGKGVGKTISKYAEKLKATDASLKVWIGGLSEKTTWKALEKHFEAAVEKPAITEIMGKGSAVLAYKTVDQVSEAVASLDGSELDGNSIQVDVWVEKPKTERQERPPRKAAPKFKPVAKLAAQPVRKVMVKGGKGKGSGKGKDDKTKERLAQFTAAQKVWIGGLSETTTWKTLEKHLAEISKPKITHIYKGKGVAAYESEEDASTIIAALNGSELDGAILELDVWTKPEREKKEPNGKEVKEVKGSVKAEL